MYKSRTTIDCVRNVNINLGIQLHPLGDLELAHQPKQTLSVMDTKKLETIAKKIPMIACSLNNHTNAW